MDLFRRMRRAQGAPLNFPVPQARTGTSNAMNPESAPPSRPSTNGETQSQIGSATTSDHDTPAEAAPAVHNPMLSLANTADILLRTGLDPDILMSALMVQRQRDADASNPAAPQPSTPQAPEPVFPVRPPARHPYLEQQQQQYHQQYYQPQQYYHQEQQYQPQQQHQDYQQYYHPHQQYYQQPPLYPHQYHHHQPQQLQAPPTVPNFRFYNPETRRTERQPVPAPAPAPAPVIVDLTSPERPTPTPNHDEMDLE